jgi:hypothetical protein
MPGWVGRGVSTPLLPFVAVGVGVGVIVEGGVEMLAELVTTGIDEVVNVEGVGVGVGVGTADDCIDEAELEAGAGAGSGAAGSSVVSIQYDFPTTKLPQAASTEGFYMSCQRGRKYKEAAESLPIDETLRVRCS